MTAESVTGFTIMSGDDRERIARLEANQHNLTALMKKVEGQVEDMHKDFTKAKGIYAGVIFTVSAIWGLVIGVWQFIKHKVS